MPDHPTLTTARTAAEILEAATRFEWWERQRRETPDDAIPSEADLLEWLPQCPETAQAEAREAAAAMRLIGPDAELTPTERSPWRAFGDPAARAKAAAALYEERGAGNLPSHFDPEPFLARIARLVFAGVTRLRPISPIGRMPGGMGIVESGVLELPEIHRRWLDLPEPRPRHPLAPIVKAWLVRPTEVEPETRQDRRILPVVRLTESRPERQLGMLFGGLLDGRDLTAQRELPLFPQVTEQKRVPLLDIVDAAGVPIRARRGGVALEGRFFVRTLASVRPLDRRLMTVRMALTFRELRDGLFPHGWHGSRDRDRLLHALMTARDYAIHDGCGRWWPLALRSMPDQPGLDDLIVLDVAFPPGSHSGPVIDLPEMDRLSVTSSARWRAFLAAPSVAWKPGVTRVPGPRSGGRYLWTRDRAAYPVLTLEDRRRLAFGADDTKNRTRAEIDAAWRDLPGLVVVGEREVDPRTGEVGWLVLPADAARAIGATGDDDGGEE